MAMLREAKHEVVKLLEEKLSPSDKKAMILANGMPEKWEKPRFFDEFSSPAFPVHCLPDKVREYVESVAEFTQTPPDMAASFALGVLATACQKKFEIEGKPGWAEPLNLYLTSVAPPAERKSAVQKKMVAPIYKYEKDTNKLIKNEVEKSEYDKNVLKKRIKRLEEQTSKAPDDEDLNKLAEELIEELANFKEVRPLKLQADDITTEKLANIMTEQGEKIAIMSTEGGIFDAMQGRYSNSINIDLFLKAHSGDYYRVDRVTRGSDALEAPAITFILAIQPNVLEGLMSNPDMRGRGLPARFLYSVPTSKVGNRKYDSDEIPPHITLEYIELITTMLDFNIPEPPGLIKLSEAAHELSSNYFYYIEPQLKGELEDIGDFAGKLHGSTLRIAGLLHCAYYAGQDASLFELQKETMEGAIEIGLYYLAHAKKAFQIMGADKETAKAKYVLSRISKQKADSISKSEIHQRCRGRFKKIADLEPIIDILVENNYLVEAPTAEIDRTGRKPAPNYYINPYIYTLNELNALNKQFNVSNVINEQVEEYKGTKFEKDTVTI